MVGDPYGGRTAGTPGALSPGCALSARGISNCNREDLGKRWRHRRTYRQEPGHKGGVGGAPRKLAVDGEKTLQGVAELAYQQSFEV